MIRYLLIFIVVNTAGQVFLKFASCENRLFIPCYLAGVLLIASSFFSLIALYRTADNPVLAYGLAFSCVFLLTQIIFAVIFKPSLNWMHYFAILSVAIGIILFSVANSFTRGNKSVNHDLNKLITMENKKSDQTKL